MLILLPPSEGKWAPSRGKSVEMESMGFPALHDAREAVLSTLIDTCTGDVDEATKALGLSATQVEHVLANRELRQAPTARAARVYSGVLYEALDPSTLDASAKRRLASRVAIASALFGLVRPGHRIPAYRLSGDVTLPSLGPVAKIWREAYAEAIPETPGSGLLVDARSGTYANFWKPTGKEAERTVTVRVLTDVGGVRKTVSHNNKATKGRLVRAILTDGGNPRTPGAFAEMVRDLGWHAEITEQSGKPALLDVVVEEV